MPLYEYLCRDCEKESEILIRHSQENPTCPECGGQKLMKLLSVPAAPATGASSEGGPPAGPCGQSCGCFPG